MALIFKPVSHSIFCVLLHSLLFSINMDAQQMIPMQSITVVVLSFIRRRLNLLQHRQQESMVLMWVVGVLCR